MLLSQRERYIAIAAAAVIGILALDRLVLDPLLVRRAALGEQVVSAQDDLARAERAFTERKRLERQWKGLGGDKLKRDASEAESQVLHAVRDWAQDAGLALSSVKPERVEKERGFAKITLRATAGGSMSQISKFLYRVQTAEIPVRLTDMQITSRKEGADDLALTLGLATICQAPDEGKEKDKDAKPIKTLARAEEVAR